MPVVLAVPLIDALLELGAFVVALVVPFIFGPVLRDLFGRIPFFGNQIVGWVESILRIRQVDVIDWAAHYATPLVELIFTPVNSFLGWLSIMGRWAGVTTQAVLTLGLVSGGAAGSLGQKIASIISQIGSIGTELGSIISTLGNLIGAFRTALAVTIPGWIATAVAELHTLFQAGLTVERLARLVAVSEVYGVIASLQQAAFAAIQAGDAALAHELAHTAVGLAQSIVSAEATALRYTDVVATRLGVEITDVKDVAIPAALTIALTATATLATRLDTLQRECIDPACGALGAGLDLFALLALGAELLAVVTMLQEAQSNPQRAARDLVNGVDELISLARPVLDFVGIKV